MSFLSKLNPLKWIKDLLISDYVGSALRHVLTAFGAILLTYKLGSAELVTAWVDATIALVTSHEFLSQVLELVTGVSALVGGLAASVKNKKTP